MGRVGLRSASLLWPRTLSVKFTMKLIPLVIPIVLCQTAHAAESPYKFDIPGGQYQEIINVAIEDNGGISCSIDAQETSTNEQWGAAVIITISDEIDPNSTQVIYSPKKDKHTFTITTLEDQNTYSYNSHFLKLNNGGGTVTSSIFWRDDGLILYKGKDSTGQQGVGYIINPDQVFGKIVVTLSGVKGSIDCYEDEI